MENCIHCKALLWNTTHFNVAIARQDKSARPLGFSVKVTQRSGMKFGMLFAVPALAHGLGDAAQYLAGSEWADLAVWMAAGFLFNAMLSAWWVPRDGATGRDEG